MHALNSSRHNGHRNESKDGDSCCSSASKRRLLNAVLMGTMILLDSVLFVLAVPDALGYAPNLSVAAWFVLHVILFSWSAAVLLIVWMAPCTIKSMEERRRCFKELQFVISFLVGFTLKVGLIMGAFIAIRHNYSAGQIELLDEGLINQVDIFLVLAHRVALVLIVVLFAAYTPSFFMILYRVFSSDEDTDSLASKVEKGTPTYY
jgi:hypothetical protein